MTPWTLFAVLQDCRLAGMEIQYVIKYCEKSLSTLFNSHGLIPREHAFWSNAEYTATLSSNLILSNLTESQTVWGLLVEGVGFKLVRWKDTGLVNSVNTLYPAIFTFFNHPGTKINPKMLVENEFEKHVKFIRYVTYLKENRLNLGISASVCFSIHEAHIL